MRFSLQPQPKSGHHLRPQVIMDIYKYIPFSRSCSFFRHSRGRQGKQQLLRCPSVLLLQAVACIWSYPKPLELLLSPCGHSPSASLHHVIHISHLKCLRPPSSTTETEDLTVSSALVQLI